MARLLKSKAKGHWDKQSWNGGTGCDCEDFRECWGKSSADVDAIGWENIMHFPIADGQALYKVIKENPLTLQHIPVGDAYEVSNALLRGLRSSDLEDQRYYDEMWQRLSDNRKVVNVGD